MILRRPPQAAHSLMSAENTGEQGRSAQAMGQVTLSYERGSSLYSKEAPTGQLPKDKKS